VRSVPVLEQYQRVKRNHPDAILLFRLGDFYEMFGADAERAVPILGIALTSRELGKGQRFPMAGVPYQAYQPYVGKLLRAGHSVALCDQVEAAAPGRRGLVNRAVVRVLTPGMVVEEAYLEPGRGNYAVALCPRPHHNGVAALDCSTGELVVIRTDAGDDPLTHELARLRPAEVIAPADQRAHLQGLLAGTPVRWAEPADFDVYTASAWLRSLLGVETLAAFGCEEWPESLAAAGALLQHAERAHLKIEPGLLRLRAEHPRGFMHLDPTTRHRLGLGDRGELSQDEDLFALLNLTLTPMGARRLRAFVERPLRDRPALEARLDQVGEMVDDAPLRSRVRIALRPVQDLERLVTRAAQGAASPRDLRALARTLAALPAIRSAFPGWPPLPVSLPPLQAELERALVEDPPPTLRDGGVFRPGYDPELDAIQERSHAAREWIAQLERVERERTGIRSLRVGFNQVFGYYLEVSHANRELVPREYVRRQTLVNAERYVTPELKEQEALVLNAKSALVAREQSLFRALCAGVAARAGDLLEAATRVADLDAWAALAEMAVQEGWARPELRDEAGLEIRAGRHPLVERTAGPGRFVPNDLVLEPNEAQIVLLTGPNMAGKSTYLRQAALIVLLAHAGSYVPAQRARIGICDRIFTRVGAHDELARGLSTFMVEMVETAHILAHATPRSLLILDEIGRGTSTYDGISIAQALLEYLHEAPQQRALTLFATHYHELTALAERFPRLRNFRMEVREDGERVIFLHQVVAGGADRSYGLHVAELAGIPRQVVLRARAILKDLEGTRPLERPAPSDQLGLALETPLLQELRQLDLERLTPREALNKLFQWQVQHAGS